MVHGKDFTCCLCTGAAGQTKGSRVMQGDAHAANQGRATLEGGKGTAQEMMKNQLLKESGIPAMAAELPEESSNQRPLPTDKAVKHAKNGLNTKAVEWKNQFDDESSYEQQRALLFQRASQKKAASRKRATALQSAVSLEPLAAKGSAAVDKPTGSAPHSRSGL